MVVRCLICNRPLRDADSIKRKIGPTCLRRLNEVRRLHKRKKIEKLKGQITMFEVIKK